MRLYEQGSSHRLKALGFRPNYVGGIFYEAPSLPLPNAERAPLPWTLRPADRLDRPGSPAPSQRLSSSPLPDKRGFENEGTAKLRRAGTPGPLWVFAPLIPAHAGRGNAMRTPKWNQAKK